MSSVYTPTTVSIALRKNRTIEVEATMYKDSGLAFHKRLLDATDALFSDTHYSITHIDSGYELVCASTLGKAKTAIRKLSETSIDWKQSKEALKKNWEYTSIIVREVQDTVAY